MGGLGFFWIWVFDADAFFVLSSLFVLYLFLFFLPLLRRLICIFISSIAFFMFNIVHMVVTCRFSSPIFSRLLPSPLGITERACASTFLPLSRATSSSSTTLHIYHVCLYIDCFHSVSYYIVFVDVDSVDSTYTRFSYIHTFISSPCGHFLCVIAPPASLWPACNV